MEKEIKELNEWIESVRLSQSFYNKDLDQEVCVMCGANGKLIKKFILDNFISRSTIKNMKLDIKKVVESSKKADKTLLFIVGYNQAIQDILKVSLIKNKNKE